MRDKDRTPHSKAFPESPIPLSEWIQQGQFLDKVVLLCGLPASGKSATAAMITQRWGMVCLSTDAIRQQVLEGMDITDPKVASDISGRLRVYGELLERARKVGKGAPGLILDGTFLLQDLRARAARVAKELSKGMILVETRCPDELALTRISQRDFVPGRSNALTAQAYLNNKASFEPVNPQQLNEILHPLPFEYWMVDTSDDGPERWKAQLVMHCANRL